MLFAVLLVAVFWSWSRVEPTLSIHSITTARRELFYWAAVLATFAMGTALGDLAAYTLNLGFLSAGILFAVLFALPGLAYYAFRINAILAFWAAYVMTRPLGASFADWTGKSRSAGGLGIGDGPVAAVLARADRRRRRLSDREPQRPDRSGRARPGRRQQTNLSPRQSRRSAPTNAQGRRRGTRSPRRTGKLERVSARRELHLDALAARDCADLCIVEHDLVALQVSYPRQPGDPEPRVHE